METRYWPQNYAMYLILADHVSMEFMDIAVALLQKGNCIEKLLKQHN